MILAELGLTYDTIYLDFSKSDDSSRACGNNSKSNEFANRAHGTADEQKGPEFTKLNPNGRIPVLVDHHNDEFTLWYVEDFPVYVWQDAQLHPTLVC